MTGPAIRISGEFLVPGPVLNSNVLRLGLNFNIPRLDCCGTHALTGRTHVICVFREIWLMKCRERGRIGGEVSAQAAIVAAAEINVLNSNGVGDGLGMNLAGGAARVLAFAREFGISPGLFLPKCTGICGVFLPPISLLSTRRF